MTAKQLKAKYEARLDYLEHKTPDKSTREVSDERLDQLVMYHYSRIIKELDNLEN